MRDFQRIDKDKSGSLSRKELMDSMYARNTSLRKDTIDKIFEETWKDDDTEVNLSRDQRWSNGVRGVGGNSGSQLKSAARRKRGGGGEESYRREVVQIQFLRFTVFGFRAGIWTKILTSYMKVTNHFL